MGAENTAEARGVLTGTVTKIVESMEGAEFSPRHVMKEMPTPTRAPFVGLSTARLLAAQDEERRRISRELHDSVGQMLIGLKMGLGKLRKSLNPTQSRQLEEIEIIVDDAISEVRTVSHLLHPPTLDLMGLRSSIVWYAEGFQQRAGIHTTVEIPEPLPLFRADARTALFRIMQESLTNVHRHARASNVTIRVAVTSDQLRLEITDDGNGFDDLNGCREGIVLLGMRERAGELNGALRIESAKGAGSSIIATIPLNNGNAVEVDDVIPTTSTVSPGRRVLLVEDHEVTRRGIRALIEAESDLEVCGEAASAKEAVDQTKSLHPDVIILDLQLPDESGWSVIRQLRQSRAESKIIIFSHHEREVIQRTARVAGSDGFVSKSDRPEDLIRAIRSVLAGNTFFEEKA